MLRMHDQDHGIQVSRALAMKKVADSARNAFGYCRIKGDAREIRDSRNDELMRASKKSYYDTAYVVYLRYSFNSARQWFFNEVGAYGCGQSSHRGRCSHTLRKALDRSRYEVSKTLLASI
jgi:hypothetical protein